MGNCPSLLSMNRKIILAVLAGSLLAAPTAVSQLGYATGSEMLQRFPDPLSIMQSRSPGPRAPGAVSDKGPRLALAKEPDVPLAAIPHMVNVIPTTPYMGDRMQIFVPDFPTELPVQPLSFREMALADLPQLTGGGVIGGQPGNGIVPIGSGIGGGVFIPGNPITATPAVPEPSTWAMLIIGFTAVGYSLRKRQAPHFSQAV